MKILTVITFQIGVKKMHNFKRVILNEISIDDILVACCTVLTPQKLKEMGKLLCHDPIQSEKNYQTDILRKSLKDLHQIRVVMQMAKEIDMPETERTCAEAISLVEEYVKLKVTDEEVLSKDLRVLWCQPPMILDLSNWHPKLIKEFNRKCHKLFFGEKSHKSSTYLKLKYEINPELIRKVESILPKLALGFPKVYVDPTVRFSITMTDGYNPGSSVGILKTLIEEEKASA